jgi:RimJ/RimL family protein N-acetyltransferase
LRLVDLHHSHFPGLFQVTAETEHYLELDRNTSDRLFSQREGFTLLADSGEVAGHITFSDYAVKLDVVIHCSVLPQYQKRWLTKSIYKRVFDRVFHDLECKRASGFAIAGLTDLTFHERLGFRLEGIYRTGVRLREQYYDLLRYGMLAHERRW